MKSNKKNEQAEVLKVEEPAGQYDLFLEHTAFPANKEKKFTFIDLFAGIGGIRSGFDAIGGHCVFTSEWNKHAVRTYKANWYCDEQHRFNQDIRDVTLSNQSGIPEEVAYRNIDEQIPDHDVLLAGFPC